MKYTLLLVDDDPWCLEMLRDILPWDDLNIQKPYQARSMEEAVRVFEKDHVDIMISDIEMLGHSGFDLLEWVRKEHTETQTAFLTCHSRIDYAQKAIKLGVRGYLLKPVREPELLELLEICIKSIPEHENTNDESGKKRIEYSDLVNRTMHYVQQHLSEPVTRESISRELYVHENHLSRVFSSETGMTLTNYITECRIQKAKELLVSTNLSITEIASLVGYNYAAYFTKIFKDKTGTTPNQWRKEARHDK